MDAIQDEVQFDPLLGIVGVGGRIMTFADRPVPRGTYFVAFDGSGTIDQDRVVTYAGAATTHLQWLAFNEAWNFLLRKHDLAYLKMAEAMSFYGEFQPKFTEWGIEREARRAVVLHEFASLKVRYGMRVAGSGVVIGTTSPFGTSDTILTKKKTVFQHAILALLGSVPPDFTVQFVCDIEKDVQENYRGWIEGLISTHAKNTPLIVGIGFFDDQHIYSLQLADMIAWVSRQEINRRFSDPTSEANPLYALLFTGSTATFEAVGPDGVALGIRTQL